MASLLVVVTGAPAVGKSRLAERLAAELRLPLLAKDDVKLALYETFGAPDQDASHLLGEAAFEVLFTVVRRLLEAGAGAVLEGNFVRGRSEARMAPLTKLASAVQVWCGAAREETLRRYSERRRHPMHFDEANLARIVAALDSGRHDPLDLAVPSIRVDTTDGYRPSVEEILAFVRRAGGRS